MIYGSVALELLVQGFNAIIHGRNGELLANHSSRSVSIFVWDTTRTLTPGGTDLSEVILSHMADKILAVLVNNVGYTSTYHSFALHPMEINMIVNLQISSMTHLTRAVLPLLIQNQPWLIINVRGLTVSPCPYLAVHSGGKTYLTGFSRTLALELEIVRDPPVDIECLAVDVHNVSTNSNSSAGFFEPTDEKMGRSRIDSTLAKEMIAMKVREGRKLEQAEPNRRRFFLLQLGSNFLLVAFDHSNRSKYLPTDEF